MRVELQTRLITYGTDGEYAVLLRKEVDCTYPPRSGDRVIVNEGWEPVTVLVVTWDEQLTSLVAELDMLDADEVAPIDVSLELLASSGWHAVEDVADLNGADDEAAVSPPP